MALVDRVRRFVESLNECLQGVIEVLRALNRRRAGQASGS